MIGTTTVITLGAHREAHTAVLSWTTSSWMNVREIKRKIGQERKEEEKQEGWG